MATIKVYHVQAIDRLLGNLEALNSQSLCDRLSYLPTVEFTKICSFPLQWRMSDEDILDEAFAVTNSASSFDHLNEWYKSLQKSHQFYSGSAGDIYILEELDSPPRGYLALFSGWQLININPIQKMLSQSLECDILLPL